MFTQEFGDGLLRSLVLPVAKFSLFYFINFQRPEPRKHDNYRQCK